MLCDTRLVTRTFAGTAGRMDATASLTSSTMKPRTGGHWDSSLPAFHPHPTGPYEDSPTVHDSESAHEHFTGRREIKLRDPRCGPRELARDLVAAAVVAPDGLSCIDRARNPTLSYALLPARRVQ